MDSICRAVMSFGKRKVAKKREIWKQKHGGEATEVARTSLRKANCQKKVLQKQVMSKNTRITGKS